MSNGRAPDPRSTTSIATLTVSPACYDEIAAKLRKADYFHALRADGVIDMHGLGLVRLPSETVTLRES